MLQQMKSQVSFIHRIGCQTLPFPPGSTISYKPLLCYSVPVQLLRRDKNSGGFNMVFEPFIWVHLDAFQFISVQETSYWQSVVIRKVDTIL